jgi:YVTN family beta-propeller protein
MGTSIQNLAITPDGTIAYALNGNTGLIPVTLATDALGATLILVADSSFIAMTPDGKTAYVTNSINNTVTPISIATNLPGPLITVGNNALGIAITPDGTTAYVCNFTDNTVTAITLATSALSSPIPVGVGPTGIAITPDGKTAYVTNFTDGTVTPITIATNSAGAAIAGFGPAPNSIAITPDGQTAYVCAGGGTLIPLTIATNTAGTPISIAIAVTRGVTITPDGKTAYVTASSGTGVHIVRAVDTATNTLGPTINAQLAPRGIAMSPDPAPLALFTVTPAKAGSPSTFDASASVSAVGTIASYAWDFGDGNTATTLVPVTTHTYTSGGPFTARLTVTNSAGTSTTQVFTGQTMSRNGSSFATTTQTVTLPPTIFPPSNASGVQQKDRFLTQTDLINVITWNPPILGETPAFYKVYRDNLTDLIAVVPANAVSLSVQDHNRKKNHVYTYFLFSVDAQGVVSTSEAVTVEPN